METPGPRDGGQLPRSLADHFAHGQVHPWLAIEGDAVQLKRIAVRLGVGHDVHGLHRVVERDLVRSAPNVQLGLALLGLIVCVYELSKVCLMSMSVCLYVCMLLLDS